MAKFIKSIFSAGERRKSCRYEEPGEERELPPDPRRKLSISRSGRMKQANRKRHSLSLDLYGENYQTEEAKNVEYHVNPQPNPAAIDPKKTDAARRNSAEESSPEQEIDIAFRIIDNT